MQKQSSESWLVADFFTHRHRISGRADVRQNKLADQLNDHTTSFLQLEEVYISNIEHPAEVGTHRATAILPKDNLTAIVVSRQEDGLPREHSYGSYYGSYLRQTFITIPSFEVEGHLRLSGRLDLRTVLTTGTENFITILDGQMKSSVNPDVTFAGGAILVNKNCIGSFSVGEREE